MSNIASRQAQTRSKVRVEQWLKGAKPPRPYINLPTPLTSQVYKLSSSPSFVFYSHHIASILTFNIPQTPSSATASSKVFDPSNWPLESKRSFLSTVQGRIEEIDPSKRSKIPPMLRGMNTFSRKTPVSCSIRPDRQSPSEVSH